MYKAIVFDLDGTLYPRECELHHVIIRRIKTWLKKELRLNSEASIDACYNGLKEKYQDIITGVKQLGLNSESYHEEVFLSLTVSQYLSADKSLQQALYRISATKYVVTRSPHEFAKSVLENLGITNFFESVLVLGTHWQGPDKLAAYEKIKQYRNYSAEDMLIVGDNYQVDLKSAQKQGYQCLLIGSEDHKMVDTIQKVSDIELEDDFI